MAARNAASVFPDPVGAAMSTFCPDWISGHARAWGSVAAEKCLRNQASTAGWNVAVGMELGLQEDVIRFGKPAKVQPGRHPEAT